MYTPTNQRVLFSKIKKEMDPLSFGLSKNQKLVSPQAITSYPLDTHQKLFQQSTMAFHYKKSENGLTKSQDLFPADTLDTKLFSLKNRQAQQQYRKYRLNSDRNFRSSSEFFPSIFSQVHKEFEQPRLQSQENQVFQTILKEQDILKNKPQLIDQISKLKHLGLLKNYDEKAKRCLGKFKVEYVYNDYHSRATNAGYARNGLGSFYTS